MVVPSIPGFGLSGPTREIGWTVKRVANAWAEQRSVQAGYRYEYELGGYAALQSTRPQSIA